MMSEAVLTNFLLQHLHGGALKKLIGANSHKNVQFYKEIGSSSYIADICISLSLRSEEIEDNNNTQAELIAIEVKISDWQNGLYQAWRYNNFAEKSFLAIYKPYADKASLEEFVSNNIGLIIFDEKNIKVLHRPKVNKFCNNTYEAHMREKILKSLSNTQSVYPT